MLGCVNWESTPSDPIVPNSDATPILIATGMHRSGTSLTAALLQSAGTDIGRELVAPYIGNLKGHFENVDFLQFHQKILRSRHLDEVGLTLHEISPLDESETQLACEVVANNASDGVWGWKDPRATLFLLFWEQLLPNARFLLVYRSPWEVADSLYRRGTDEMFKRSPELAVELWMHYNRKIVEFCDRHAQQCLLTRVDWIIADPVAYIETVNRRFEINLAPPATEIYDRDLFDTRVSSDPRRMAQIAHYFPQALKLYRELNDRAWKPAKIAEESRQLPTEPPAYDRHLAFRDWVDLRDLERRYRTLEAECSATDFALADHPEAVRELQAALARSQGKLQRSRAETMQLQCTIEAMESSKFWKLRSAWFRLKQAIGLPVR